MLENSCVTQTKPAIAGSARFFSTLLEIYLRGTRMFMVLEVAENFSFERKAEADRKNPKVQEWENLMWKFQKALPEAQPGEKWLPMERIFKLDA
jgi:L-rhamnose mutarotase